MDPKPPLTPEILVPLIGKNLVEEGVITPADLDSALDVQREMRANGQEALLGEILVQLGKIDRATLDRAVTVQIIQFHSALQEVNAVLERRVEERTAELQNAFKKLSELNQLKSNIIANVSHELRTPMTHFKGYLELLSNLTLGPLNKDQEDALRIMQKSSDRLEQLIEELIQFSLASKGEFTLRLAEIDLRTICASQIERARPKATERNVILSSNIPDDLPFIRCDEDKISWVIMQLLDNAIKFTPPQGQVTLRLERKEGLVHTTITDTGIGIAQERIGEIFEPFHQLDGASTRRYGGTGLGLALVQQIIEAHGSTIHVYSQVGQGSQFEFVLPIHVD